MRDEDFILSLTKDLEAKDPLVSSQKALLLWMLVTFAVLVSGLLMVKIRPDVNQMLETLSFNFELFSALSVGILAAGTALHLRIPGAKAPQKVLGFAVSIWMASLLFHSYSMHVTEPFSLKLALHCMASIVGLSALPGLVLYLLIRRGATTEPKQTLAIVGVAMTAAAAAFLPLSCGNDTALHLVIGHGGPAFIFGGLFWFIGPSLLRW
ncbi:MAG: NrsF family protein [Bdellovibrionota bacterium]